MQPSRRRHPEGAARFVVVAAAAVMLGLVALPLAAIFVFALEKGLGPAIAVLERSDVHAAAGLSALAAALTVPFVTVFGTAVAWVVTRTEVPGRRLLFLLANVPFVVPPVVSGLLVILTLGPRTPLGGWLRDQGISVCFATPAVVIATALVSLGVVVKDLVPLLETLGPGEEIAARTLGATPLQAFWRVTMPGLRLPLLHASVGALARALGEFGSVTVVSGRIRGETMTVPLLIEALYGEYDRTAAFALAAMLAIVALCAVALKKSVEFALSRDHDEECS